MSTQTRRYRMNKRAASKDKTRRRIIDATMQLHEEVGPRATTISAIANRAGVQRLTVYRHFPDEEAVFEACTTHWLELNPPPDPAGWADVADPMKRFEKAAAAFYAYYARTRRMWRVAFRDLDEVPALEAPMEKVAAFIDEVAADLAAAFDANGGQRRILSTIRHALSFQTWSDLEAQGIGQRPKTALVCAWLSGVRNQR